MRFCFFSHNLMGKKTQANRNNQRQAEMQSAPTLKQPGKHKRVRNPINMCFGMPFGKGGIYPLCPEIAPVTITRTLQSCVEACLLLSHNNRATFKCRPESTWAVLCSITSVSTDKDFLFTFKSFKTWTRCSMSVHVILTLPTTGSWSW